MKKVIYFSLLSVIIGGLLMGCGSEEVQPRAINEETDKCPVCNMSVMDNQFATQVVLEDGLSHVFDDLGCMYVWLDENPDEEIAATFVRDYNNEEWIRSEDAFYVYNMDVKTPMAYNMISFENQDSADEFIAENDGELIAADALADHDWQMNHEMMEGHGHEGDHGHGEMKSDHGHSDKEESGSH
ncbi:nitrous oxide reductase accessory protein NosL [Cytobacillus gottheilii]|uniref:nitrous oxide reductase accessory protein NosL n=1 Tax=Cytobacillus gottheilii TaxID=859144 RepID=UPI001119BC91|nr:nitrous oxide reductase accessory protein NosL [Cytobacillus gottheilii]